MKDARSDVKSLLATVLTKVSAGERCEIGQMSEHLEKVIKSPQRTYGPLVTFKSRFITSLQLLVSYILLVPSQILLNVLTSYSIHWGRSLTWHAY